MRRNLLFAALGLLLGAAVTLGVVFGGRHRPALPESQAVAFQIRELARLETLQISLYKKLHFSPEPLPTGSLWGDVLNWARYQVRTPFAKAIVFAEAYLGLDLDRLGPDSLLTVGREAWVVLPAVRVRVELKPAETEIIGSSLDSQETARLFELAREAFAREVEANEELRERARASAERSIRGLLLGLGFEKVHFVERLPLDRG